MRLRYATALLFSVGVLSACGGGGGSAGGGAAAGPSATVSVAFPYLFDESGTKVLGTYISHVVTSQRYPLASVTVQNTGPATTMQVAVDLPTYGSASTQTISLAAGQSQTLTLSPIINFQQLFQLTTAVPAALDVNVTAGGTSLFQQSYPIQISGRDTVFWANNGQSTVPLIATMVTPTDKASAVATLLRNAAPLMPGGMVLGYQLGAWPSTALGPISPGLGNQQQESFNVLLGESPTVTIDNVVNGVGGSDTASVFILDDANYEAWASGSAATGCAVNSAVTAGAVLTCTTPPAGLYHIVYYNPGTNLTSRTVTRHRPMMETETTYYQTQAIFQQLRKQGMIYVNVPGGTGFFAASQNVKYPSESLALSSANCIDGSLVFASAWEAMGMEPILAVDPAHGHAFVAVRCWSGTSCVIPVETTMVGGSATFADAVNTATANWNAWTSDTSLVQVDIAAARAAGLTPAPM